MSKKERRLRSRGAYIIINPRTQFRGHHKINVSGNVFCRLVIMRPTVRDETIVVESVLLGSESSNQPEELLSGSSTDNLRPYGVLGSLGFIPTESLGLPVEVIVLKTIVKHAVDVPITAYGLKIWMTSAHVEDSYVVGLKVGLPCSKDVIVMSTILVSFVSDK